MAKTPTRPIRIDLELWDEFGAVAEPDRSAVLREFMEWYVRRPGVKLPRRPAVDRSAEGDQANGVPPSAP